MAARNINSRPTPDTCRVLLTSQFRNGAQNDRNPDWYWQRRQLPHFQEPVRSRHPALPRFTKKQQESKLVITE